VAAAERAAAATRRLPGRGKGRDAGRDEAKQRRRTPIIRSHQSLAGCPGSPGDLEMVLQSSGGFGSFKVKLVAGSHSGGFL